MKVFYKCVRNFLVARRANFVAFDFFCVRRGICGALRTRIEIKQQNSHDVLVYFKTSHRANVIRRTDGDGDISVGNFKNTRCHLKMLARYGQYHWLVCELL